MSILSAPIHSPSGKAAIFWAIRFGTHRRPPPASTHLPPGLGRLSLAIFVRSHDTYHSRVTS